MNKNAIKSYAIWARKELIDRVKRKAYEYEVTENSTPKVSADSVNGRLLTNIEKTQLNSLIIELYKHSFNHVIEEVAYTWFNRFIALRFMEVNGFLPQKINVFTNDNNEFKPQILDEAISVELKSLDKQIVIKYIEDNNQDELYKYLLLCLCNDMNDYLPDMFTPIDDYKALLIPDNLLNEGSIIDRLVKDIPVEDWTDQVQIIGWLYQYYNSELKDTVMKKKEYSKDDIPAATQLFTPDWIVRYMVENSLGRLWLDGHPNFKHEQWEYYLEESEQEPEVLEQLNIIKQEHVKIKPEEIKVIDPCMGSGHILVYAFDVLMDIYRDNGYSDRDAARSILENNLYGIEIDERAYQLAYFAIMMKTRSYNRRILNEHINHNLVEITESNNINRNLLHYLDDYEEIGRKLIELFKDAKEFGSLINVDIPIETINKLEEKLLEVERSASSKDLITETESIEFIQAFSPLLKQAKILAQKYDVVITNPPYMAPSPRQKSFVESFFPRTKDDLYTVFMEKCNEMSKKYGFSSLINQQSWMYLVTFETTRYYILTEGTFLSLIHLGANAFEDIGGEVVQNCAYVYRNYINNIYKSSIIDLRGENSSEAKQKKYLDKRHDRIYFTSKEYLSNSQYLFDYSPKVYDDSVCDGNIEQHCSVLRGPSFPSIDCVKLWFEVSKETNKKWRLCSRNGMKYRWFAPVIEIVEDTILQKSSNYVSHSFEGVLWNDSRFGNPTTVARYKATGTSYESAMNLIKCDMDEASLVLSLFNLGYYEEVLKGRVNGQHFSPIYIKKLPYFLPEKGVTDCVRNILDEFNKMEYTDEMSYNFKTVLMNKTNIELEYNAFNDNRSSSLSTIENLEKQIIQNIDRYFYKKSDSQNKVYYTKTSNNEYIKIFISYAVGCMFGRYSLDAEGLVYAGGEWDEKKYKSFTPDQDDIIPIYEDELYGDDDITGRFIDFVRVVFGEEELEANLKFIADSLYGKDTPRRVIREYFINDFIKDHSKAYQKRPIYWQFDSGKKNGFKALIYIHRYKPDLIARMRTEYIHPQQARFRTQISLLEAQLQNADKANQIKINKQIQSIKEKANELAIYEEKIHHWADKMEPMDLDDGVKTNYAKFQELLSRLK